MNTKHLAYLVEVAKCGSISKAAKKLYLSQPSLSASIAALEEEIGVVLFRRSRSGVVLTEQGEQIIEVAVEILRGVDQIEEIARQDHVLTGQIRLSAIPAACGSFLVDLIGRAQERYPHLSIVVQEQRPRYIIQQVLRGEINLGVTSVLQSQEADYRNLFQETRLTYEALYEDKLCLFVAAEHPLAKQTVATVDEMNQYPMTCFQEDVYLHQLVHRKHSEQGKGVGLVRITYQFNNLDNIKKIACNNLAGTILPKRMAQQDEFIRSHLVPVDIAGQDVDFSVGAIYRSGGLLSNGERRLIEMLREFAETEPT